MDSLMYQERVRTVSQVQWSSFEGTVEVVSKCDLADAVHWAFRESCENDSPKVLSKMKLL